MDTHIRTVNSKINGTLQRCLLAHFEGKFATAKVECSFEMGK